MSRRISGERVKRLVSEFCVYISGRGFSRRGHDIGSFEYRLKERKRSFGDSMLDLGGGFGFGDEYLFL